MRWLLAMLMVAFGININAQLAAYPIRGYVVESVTHSPIYGAIVETHELGERAITDTSGYFQLENIFEGVHHIHVQAPGYSANEWYVNIPSDSVQLFELVPTQLELKEVLIESSYMKTMYLEHSVDLIVMDKSAMDESRGMTLAHSLSRVPGMNVINLGTGIARPVIRGLSGTRILVSDMGIKQEGQQWGSDHGLELDQFAIDRLEIIKGPGSLAFGSDALGGVIYILPPRIPQQGTYGELSSIARSNNNYLGTSAMAGKAWKHAFVQLRITLADFGDYKVPADSFVYLNRSLPIENGRLRNTAGQELHGTMTTGYFGDWGSIKWTISRFSQESGLFPGIVGIPTRSNVADDGNSRDLDLPRVNIIHEKSIVNATIRMKKGWLQVDQGFQINTREEYAVPHANAFRSDSTDFRAHQLILRSHQWVGRYHYPGKNGRKWVLGSSFQSQRNKRSGFEFLLTNFSQWQTGLFALFEWENEARNQTWNGGLRLDYGHFRSSSYTQVSLTDDPQILTYSVRAEDSDREFFNYSAGLGWSWYPSEQWNVKANFGKGFRIPDPASLSINGVHHGTFRHEQGDPHLKSESGYQLDFTTLFQTEDIMIKFTPYFNYFENYIYLRPMPFFSDLAEGGQLYRYVQNDAIYTGAEWSSDWHWVERLHAENTVEYVFSYNIQSGLSLPFTPPLQWKHRISYSVPFSKTELSFGIGGIWAGAQERTDRNEKSTPSYYLLNGDISWRSKSSSAWNLSLRVNNALNLNYFNHLSLYRNLNLPEQGRFFTLSLIVPFNQETNP